jgi:hypothetical protein
LRYTPRERPVIAQRLRCRDGLASRGSDCSFACAAARSSAPVRGLRISSFSCARCAAYRFTILARRFSRSTMLVFAMNSSYFLNGKLKASSSARPWRLSTAVVVIVMSMPRT